MRKNLTGTSPIELGAKSLILRVYDVLMNDRVGMGRARCNRVGQMKNFWRFERKRAPAAKQMLDN